MTLGEGSLLAIVILLILTTALLAAAETVLTRLDLVRALRIEEERRKGAKQLVWLVEHPTRGLNVVLLLTIVTRVTATALLTLFAVRNFADGLAVVATVAVFATASFVLAEIAPRTYTLRHIERVGLLMAAPVALLARVLRPVVHVLVLLGSALAPGRGTRHGPFTSDEELRRLMGSVEEEAEDEHELEEDERAMIRSIFELGETVAREIMVPRPDMCIVSAAATVPELVDTLISRGFSRVPVWRDDEDRVVGVIYAKDVLQRLYTDPGFEQWDDLIRVPTFIPESKPADDLLRELQSQRVHLAIVIDEYGAVAGLVTIEDILEEIVGEIVDEYDHEEPPVVHLDDHRMSVSARVTVHDLNELLGSELPEEEGWDTIGGLMIGMLGRVPNPGEALQVDGITFVAEDVQGRRVNKVLVTTPGEDTSVGAA